MLAASDIDIVYGLARQIRETQRSKGVPQLHRF